MNDEPNAEPLKATIETVNGLISNAKFGSTTIDGLAARITSAESALGAAINSEGFLRSTELASLSERIARLERAIYADKTAIEATDVLRQAILRLLSEADRNRDVFRDAGVIVDPIRATD